jgi:hypothetical protein
MDVSAPISFDMVITDFCSQDSMKTNDYERDMLNSILQNSYAWLKEPLVETNSLVLKKSPKEVSTGYLLSAQMMSAKSLHVCPLQSLARHVLLLPVRLNFLRDVLGIPVPRILDYSISSSNPVVSRVHYNGTGSG